MEMNHNQSERKKDEYHDWKHEVLWLVSCMVQVISSVQNSIIHYHVQESQIRVSVNSSNCMYVQLYYSYMPHILPIPFTFI